MCCFGLRLFYFYLFNFQGKIATNDPDGTCTSLTHSIRKSRYFGVIEVYWKPEFGEVGHTSSLLTFLDFLDFFDFLAFWVLYFIENKLHRKERRLLASGHERWPRSLNRTPTRRSDMRLPILVWGQPI
jgi:hypothetical protein